MEQVHLRKKIKIKPSEQIICMIPIGLAIDEFNVTLSYRRSADRSFKGDKL